jgi:hypothetical protein
VKRILYSLLVATLPFGSVLAGTPKEKNAKVDPRLQLLCFAILLLVTMLKLRGTSTPDRASRASTPGSTSRRTAEVTRSAGPCLPRVRPAEAFEQSKTTVPDINLSSKAPVPLPIRVAAGVVVLPFVMRFYLGGFRGQKVGPGNPLVGALGPRSLE